MALTKVTRNLLSTGIDDQSTSTAITIDSSGNVGISTTPHSNSKLHILDASSSLDDYTIHIEAYQPAVVWQDISGGPSTDFALQADGSALMFRYGDAATETQLASEAMRIDSSGRLIVGNTSAFTADSVTIDQGGFLAVRNTSGAAMEIRRDTSHGNILDLQIDGQTIGNLGSAGGYLTVLGSTNQVGLKFYSAAANTGIIHPVSGTADLDAAVDLGYSGGRFKDLYLSGGVVFDAVTGNATSNTLDDYEEGTWTPAVRGAGVAGSYTYSGGYGVYTKIGRQVTISFFLQDITEVSAGTAYLQITGCPFTKASGQFSNGVVNLQSIDWFNSSTYGTLQFTSVGASSVIYVRMNGDNYAGADLQLTELVSGASDIGGTITFFT